MASFGALQNITSYLNGTLIHLTTVLQDSGHYISKTLGIHPSIVYSSVVAIVALPITMSRYPFNREYSSPYSSMTGGAPPVTDDDFSYITSQDLNDTDVLHSDGRYYNVSSGVTAPNPEDDVLLVKNNGVVYPAHFPPYSIGDGRLYVKDVKIRIALMTGLSSRSARRIKLVYKGRQLKEPDAAIREYGVKNKSELLAIFPNLDRGSSPSEDEEMVIVGDATKGDSKSQRRRRQRAKKKADKKPDADSTHGSPSSISNSDLSKTAEPGRIPMRRLDELDAELRTKWQPLCNTFMESPPPDLKKREDEYRKLSESVLQHILLKLDEVDAESIPEVRARRKEMVKETQNLLKKLDHANAS